MGQQVPERLVHREDRPRYRGKLHRGLDALGRMLTEGHFRSPHRQIGVEVELNLVDAGMNPAMANTEVLEKIDDPQFTTELGQHNLEIDMLPRPLTGDETLALEDDLRSSLNRADSKAEDTDARLVMIGMLPTLRREHFHPECLSANTRYSQLNQQIVAARGEEMLLDLDGPSQSGAGPGERLRSSADSILPESACTSVQLHLQVAPEDFAAHWNAAQCLSAVQVAIAANSPFLLGTALWEETRIPLFLQATDTRSIELYNQGVRPRVWFGERWITSVFDLFEENVRYFPALLPEPEPEDPLEVLNAGRAPGLAALRLHNGTIWRWNRPVYDLVDGCAHVRVENRVLPAGPTVRDVVANAAFFYGVQRALTQQDCPPWMRMSFATAADNFYAAARYGMHAQVYWPGCGWSTPDELVLRVLLPLAHEGLRAYGVSDAARQRHLGVIEQRCRSGITGAVWQRRTVAALEERGRSRAAALQEMLRRYVENMDTGTPVHAWPL